MVKMEVNLTNWQSDVVMVVQQLNMSLDHDHLTVQVSIFNHHVMFSTKLRWVNYDPSRIITEFSRGGHWGVLNTAIP